MRKRTVSFILTIEKWHKFSSNEESQPGMNSQLAHSLILIPIHSINSGNTKETVQVWVTHQPTTCFRSLRLDASVYNKSFPFFNGLMREEAKGFFLNLRT